MGLLDKIERGVERAVKAPFARAFRAEVQPVEIAAAVKGSMDDRAAIVGPGRTVVPNYFEIELSDTDYERLSSYSDSLTDELTAAAEDHADNQRYSTSGPVHIELNRNSSLETGVFRLRPSTSKGAGRRAKPSGQREPASTYGSPSGYGESNGRGGHSGYGEQRPAGGNKYDAAAAGFGEGGGGRDLRGQSAPQRQEPAYDDYSSRDDYEEPTAPHRPEQRRSPHRVEEKPRPSLEIEGQNFPLLSAITVLGRDETADLILDDPGVSRHHCEFRVTHEGRHLVCSVRDLRSTNGTFVNGERVTSERLMDGDRVTIGRTSMFFHPGGR